MNIEFELPSAGKSYSKIAQFTELKLKHQKHLARFSDENLPNVLRYEAAKEILQDTLAIEGLSDFNNLYCFDFDSLLLQIRLVEIPESRTFQFSWECACKDHEDNNSNEGFFDLSSIKTTPWDGTKFNVGEYSFDFMRLGDFIEIQRMVANSVHEAQQEIDAAVKKLTENKDVNDIRVEFEIRKLKRNKIYTEEINKYVDYRLASLLIMKAETTLEERKNIIENIPYKQRIKLAEMVGKLESFGIQRVITQKCSRCGREAAIKLPFREFIKFV